MPEAIAGAPPEEGEQAAVERITDDQFSRMR